MLKMNVNKATCPAGSSVKRLKEKRQQLYCTKLKVSSSSPRYSDQQKKFVIPMQSSFHHMKLPYQCLLRNCREGRISESTFSPKQSPAKTCQKGQTDNQIPFNIMLNRKLEKYHFQVMSKYAA